ncbi:hypothetical protein GLYMA_15G229602v4 [Glycine max]|nr:hypothetical protein GLYMA_15G229602v4 [Glycine max]KAH1148501.1 hypothetical protein GYH30_043228 [Glycine max]
MTHLQLLCHFFPISLSLPTSQKTNSLNNIYLDIPKLSLTFPSLSLSLYIYIYSVNSCLLQSLDSALELN